MDDIMIVELYTKRDESAISETQKKYGAFLHRIAYSILSDNEDSDECVNDTYLKTWESIPPNRPNAFSAYIARITRNLSINLFRSRQADKRAGSQYKLSLDELGECADKGETPEGSAELGAVTKCINDYLETVSPEFRQMFVCRYFFMDSIKDICTTFGAGESKVKSALMRVRNGLREYLEKEGIDV